METYILREGVLNDHALYLSDENKVFHGGYIAIVRQYFYGSAWHNNESIKRFKKRETLDKFLQKHYPEFKF